MEQLLADFATTVSHWNELTSEEREQEDWPLEFVLYQDYRGSIRYLEFPHELYKFMTILRNNEVEAERLAQLNAEIAARYNQEHANGHTGTED